MNSESTYTTPNDWINFRPNLKVMDCTIRDGGLMNDSKFSDDAVRAVYKACVDSGVDYMEIGYKNSKKLFPQEKYGPWRHCDEEDLRRIVGDNDTSLKISVMADAEKSDYKTDIVPRDQSVIDMIRVATYDHQIPTAIEMVKDAKDKGYETTVNIMAASIVSDAELEAGLKMLKSSGTQAVYVVDSFGHLFSEQVRRLTQMYKKHIEGSEIEVGVHMHNNLQLGFSNTISGMIAGASYLDCTIGGLGRGAGNCTTELLLSFLRNPKYKERPILECLQNVIEPMREELKWGFDIPYMITGFMNRHPKSAIAHKASPDAGDFVSFYDKTVLDKE